MAGTTHQLETPVGVMSFYEAEPAGEARGAVIVVMEAFGVNDYIRRVADDFAAEGYHAFAPDLFYRAGGGVVGYDDIPKAIEMIRTLDDQSILEDLDAMLLLVRAAEYDDSRIGLVGFCIGGRIAFLASVVRALGAGVSFYGGGLVTARSERLPALIDDAATLQTPWLGLFGDADPSIPVADVEQLREGLRDAQVETEIVRYEEAGHGFHCDRRESFHPEAAADAWRRTLAWFNRHLVRRD